MHYNLSCSPLAPPTIKHSLAFTIGVNRLSVHPINGPVCHISDNRYWHFYTDISYKIFSSDGWMDGWMENIL